MSDKQDFLQVFLAPFVSLPLITRRCRPEAHGKYRRSVAESAGRKLAMPEGLPSL